MLNNFVLFDIFQRPLLSLSNNNYGRRVLDIPLDVVKDNEKIIKIHPNSVTVSLNKEVKKNNCYLPVVKTVFKPTNIYQRNLSKALKLFGGSLLSLFQPQFGFIPAPLFLLTTTEFTFASGGAGIVDNNSSSTWSTVREATTGTVTANQFYPGTQHYPTYYTVMRFFVTFLTGNTIPAVASILSGVYKPYIENPSRTTSNWTVTENSLCLEGSTQSDPTSLASGDYDNVVLNSPTEFASRITFTNLVDGAYESMNLNASGLNAIAKGTGNYTKFCNRASGDIDNVTPGAATCYDQTNTTIITTSGKEAKLSVSYSTGGTFLFNLI